MRLKIIDVNFTNDKNWLFKFSDSFSEYFVMNDSFYERNGLKSPVTKKELDYLDVGTSILCESKEIDGIKVILKIR